MLTQLSENHFAYSVIISIWFDVIHDTLLMSCSLDCVNVIHGVSKKGS